ncbi:MAG: penicillin-binding protein 1A [Hyphomonadaceae bacterium]
MLRKVVIIGGALFGAVALAVAVFVVLTMQGLPSLKQLATYEPPVTTRVYAGDGSLIAEFASQQRIYVPAAAIPDRVKQAFLSAEDKSFYEHSGIDAWSMVRGTIGNALRGRRIAGGSTITQQVAKNMLLTNERTITRKVKEIFLAERLEKAFSKERILELYLNEIYLGNRSYGVAAAALNYFNKPLDQLSLSESAFLAALPKGPENYDPRKRKERAIERRNWVLARIEENGYASKEDVAKAQRDDLVTVDRLSGDQYVASAHFVEELRRTLLKQYGEKALYEGGLSVRSTVDVRLQIAAAAALRRGLDAYDRRHGWRGPLARADAGDAMETLAKAPSAPGASGWTKAVVTNVAGGKITVSTPLGRSGLLAADDVSWAAAGAARDKKRALTRGAVVYAEPLKNGQFGLRQTPQLEGALVALDPRTGRVLAMVGGYSFGNSQYNRVTQAKRQPGSSFKPIVYTAALEYGLTPATLIEDAPFQIQAGDGTVYNPQNYEAGEFFGPSTLRTGVEKSRNAMTVRLAYEMGMDKVVEEGKKLGVYDDLMPVLAMALGAGETTLMRLTNAYASFVNGGKKVTPVLVDRVQDRTGKTVFRADMRACEGCNAPYAADAAPPEIPDTREQVLDPIIAYQITSILEGVVQRGTGQVVKSVGKPLAGKTGTTNDYKDAWFVGFSPDLVAGVWIGFDQPRTLGEGETGGGLSAPVFRDFMNVALKDQPATPFRLPPGVRLVKIDYKTGLLPGPNTTETILEAFRPGTEPVRDTGGGQQVIFGAGAMDPRALAGLDSTPSDEQPAGAGAAAPPPPMITPTRDEPLGQLY